MLFFRVISRLRVSEAAFQRTESFANMACKRQRVSASVGSEFEALEESFDALCQEMKEYDEKRERVIKRSRDIQKASKQAIFSLHRGNAPEASQRLEQALHAATELRPLIDDHPSLRHGSFSNSIEEYAEALIFQQYLTDKKVMLPRDIELANTDEYLGGLLDFTGELNRYAIARATQRDVESVQHARDCVDSIMGCMLKLDLRNGSVRKKYDALKYTLKKLENTLYELSLGDSGFRDRDGDEEAPQHQQEE